MVPPFCNPLSDDLREPRVPLRILRRCCRTRGRSSLYVESVESKLRDVCEPRLRAEYSMGAVHFTLFKPACVSYTM